MLSVWDYLLIIRNILDRLPAEDNAHSQRRNIETFWRWSYFWPGKFLAVKLLTVTLAKHDYVCNNIKSISFEH